MEHVFLSLANMLGQGGGSPRDPIARGGGGGDGINIDLRGRLCFFGTPACTRNCTRRVGALPGRGEGLETFYSWGNSTYYSIIHQNLWGDGCSNCSSRDRLEEKQFIMRDILDKRAFWCITSRTYAMDIYSSVHQFTWTVSTLEIAEWIFNTITTQH